MQKWIVLLFCLVADRSAVEDIWMFEHIQLCPTLFRTCRRRKRITIWCLPFWWTQTARGWQNRANCSGHCYAEKHPPPVLANCLSLCNGCKIHLKKKQRKSAIVITKPTMKESITNLHSKDKGLTISNIASFNNLLDILEIRKILKENYLGLWEQSLRKPK